MARRRIEAVSRTSRAVGAAFSPLTMIVLALVAVVAMAGLGVLSAYAPELKTGNDGGVHALSNSSVGYAGIVKLLRATGVPVTLSRGRVSVNASDSLLITTPPVGVNPDQVRDRIRPAPRRGRYRIENKPVASNGPTGIVAGDDFELPPTGGPVLVVLPKWSAVPEARKPGWVSTVGPVPEKAALEVLPERMRKDVGLTRGKTSGWVQLTRPSGQRIGRPVRIEALQTLSGKALAAPGWVPVLTDASGAVIVAMKGGTRTYVLSDPDLLNTQGIKSLAGAQTAVALLDLLRAEGSPVIFDLTLHGFQRTRSLLRLMLEPPLLGVRLDAFLGSAPRDSAKAVVGQNDTIDLMLTALFAGGHVLLEGPPGTAKTFLAQCFARTAVNLQFGRIQFTPDLMPGDILGANLFNFQTSAFTLVKGPIFCELLLADEINRTPPKTQAALLEAMQERNVTLDGERHPLSDRFMVVATQNPLEQQGTYPLPEAQLDRFLFKHVLAYPSLAEETAIVAATAAAPASLDPGSLRRRGGRRRAAIDRRCRHGGDRAPDRRHRPLHRRLVRATRDTGELSGGASPRCRGHAGRRRPGPRRPGRPRLRDPRRRQGPGPAGPAPPGDPVAGRRDRGPQGRLRGSSSPSCPNAGALPCSSGCGSAGPALWV
jgi:MoxR-like ATPase